MRNRISNIRDQFVKLLFTHNGADETIEIIGASFIVDEKSIFGTINEDYAKRELAWYESMSLNVDDIPGETPQIWKNVSSKHNFINSNYGFLMYSKANYSQFTSVIAALIQNKHTRQAVAVYTRPTIHQEWNRNGMADFICTNAVHYEIRNDKLHVVVQMRSQDAVFGFKNDLIWQKFVAAQILAELLREYPLLEMGDIHWQVASLHVYKRHFYLVDNYNAKGSISVPKSEYKGNWS